MSKQENNRRLAGILAADIVSYSAQMGVDEASTLARVRTLLSDLIQPSAAAHGGRVFKTMGDGFLLEFQSAVQALRCAIAIQTDLNAKADGLHLRIGVHQGEVVAEADDLFGDGVIIAARLEALAEPGGICISSRVREDAAGKITLEVDDLGETALKNIAAKIRVFRVRLEGSPALSPQSSLPLPTKPSIAVLAFTNMSADPEQEYFADGIAEDIITALSRYRWLFVIARNSSFAYKGKLTDIRQVGRELGVRYVLEGSIRKTSKRLRITAQLIEAANGAHLWAERYDGDLSDIFEMQDRVSDNVAGVIEPLLRNAEIARIALRPTNDIDVYDLFLRGLAEYHYHSREGYTAALGWLRRALDIDPTYSAALGLAGICYQHLQRQGWMENREQETAEAIRLARRAVEHGGQDATALAYASLVLCYLAHDALTARGVADRAVELSPSLATAWFAAGFARTYLGDASASLDRLAHAKRLSPLDPWMHWFLSFEAFNNFFLERDAVAAELAEQSLLRQPNHIGALLIKAFSNAHLGSIATAREATQQILQQRPEYSIAIYRFDMRQLLPKDLERVVHGLRLAGIPEG